MSDYALPIEINIENRRKQTNAIFARIVARLPIEGTGSPEGVVTANPGQTYIDTGGGVGVTFWVKETGTGNTGWDAK